jgi:hypothetical protein
MSSYILSQIILNWNYILLRDSITNWWCSWCYSVGRHFRMPYFSPGFMHLATTQTQNTQMKPWQQAAIKWIPKQTTRPVNSGVGCWLLGDGLNYLGLGHQFINKACRWQHGQGLLCVPGPGDQSIIVGITKSGHILVCLVQSLQGTVKLILCWYCMVTCTLWAWYEYGVSPEYF